MSLVNESQTASPLAVSSYRYPTGWFVVGWSSDVAPGDVKRLHYFGRELVCFRTEGGEVAIAVDASLSERLLAVVEEVPSLRTMFVRADGEAGTAGDAPSTPDGIDVHPIGRLREGDTGEVAGGTGAA